MAQLDEGTVGIKVLAGLPDGNGLPSIAAELLDDPRTVYALVELRPHAEQHRLDTDSHTLSMRITQLEPLAGTAATALRDQLRAVREARTGVSALPGIDGDDESGTPAQTGPAFPPPPGPGDVVDADGYVTPGGDVAAPDAAAGPVPAAAVDTAGVPPFVAPTPITGGRRRGATS